MLYGAARIEGKLSYHQVEVKRLVGEEGVRKGAPTKGEDAG